MSVISRRRVLLYYISFPFQHLEHTGRDCGSLSAHIRSGYVVGTHRKGLRLAKCRPPGGCSLAQRLRALVVCICAMRR